MKNGNNSVLKNHYTVFIALSVLIIAGLVVVIGHGSLTGFAIKDISVNCKVMEDKKVSLWKNADELRTNWTSNLDNYNNCVPKTDASCRTYYNNYKSSYNEWKHILAEAAKVQKSVDRCPKN